MNDTRKTMTKLRQQEAEREFEAVRQRAVQRVRDEIWKMEASGDVQRILTAVRENLLELGLSFEDIGVNLIEERTDPTTIRFFTIDPDGSQYINIDPGYPGIKVLLCIWRQQQPAYRKDLATEDVYGEKEYIKRIKDGRIRSIIDIPFSQGTLALNSFEAEAFSPKDIEILREMAQVLSEGFQRMKDFQTLEQRNQDLEREIAERRQAEKALRESEERFRSIAESANDAIIVADSEGKAIFWNRGAQTIFGYAAEEVLDKPLTFLIPERFREAHQRGMERFRATAKSNVIGKTVELSGLRKDGCEFPLELSLTSWKIHEETFYSGIIRDITGRKQAEEWLQQAHDALERRVEERTAELQREIAERQQAEREYRTILRTAMDGFYVMDKQGHFLDVNDAYFQMVGYSRDELLTMGVLDVDEGQSPGQIARSIQQVAESGHGRFEVRHRRKDGRIVDIEISTNYMEDEKRFFVFLRDITERKQAEAKLRKSEERNRTLVKECHHRVKNNLQVISSLLDLQARDVEDETVLAVLQDSCHRVHTMSLIHERLYRSANLTEIDFVDYLRTLTEDLVRSSSVGGRAISLEFQLEETTLDMDAAISCGLIVNELVTNSLQHAFAAGQKGTIGVGLQSNGSSRIVLGVWDNGTGIPPEIDFSRTPSLGLRLVMTLVRQLNGKIDLQRHSGTRFEVVFDRKG